MRPGNHRRRVQRPFLLLQRPGRQPQPNRGPIRPLHEIERMAQQDAQFIDMRRFEARQPIRRHADQRRVDRLMLPAFRRQGQAGRRRDQQEPRILVAGIDQRIQAAVDERIVHRPDRQHPRARHRRRQPGGAQQQEQVLFGDAQLDMLPLGRHPPALRRSQLRSRGTRRCGYAGRKCPAGSPKVPGWWTPSHPATSS